MGQEGSNYCGSGDAHLGDMVMDDLRNIPAPLVAKAKEMGVEPWIHKSDFVFDFVTGLWKGDLDLSTVNATRTPIRSQRGLTTLGPRGSAL